MRLSSIFSALSVVFLATVAISACVEAEYGEVAFRCEPKGGEPTCPDGYFCCSDDPASLTVKGSEISSEGKLPGFNTNSSKTDINESFAAPLAAGKLNNSSGSGMCVDREAYSLGPKLDSSAGDAAGCPIPCNPTWDKDDVETVCGKGATCCQTVEIFEADCAKDKDTGCYFPATGAEARSGEVTWLTGGDKPFTFQAPSVCGSRWNKDKESEKGAYDACIRRLGVANQRGFCLSGGKACPLASSAYKDACESKNAGITGCN